MASSKTLNDPRDSSREAKLTLPRSWKEEPATDAMSSMGMFLAGMVMVTKNRYFAWPVLILAINGAMNQQPLRSKEGGSTPWTTLMILPVRIVTLGDVATPRVPVYAWRVALFPFTDESMALFALIISHVSLFTFTDPNTGAIRFS